MHLPKTLAMKFFFLSLHNSGRPLRKSGERMDCGIYINSPRHCRSSADLHIELDDSDRP